MAFYGCTALASAIVGDGVVTLGYQAFQGCNSLASVKLGSDLRTIGYSAFESCKALTEVVIPDRVTTLAYNSGYNNKPSRTFANCIALKRVTLGKKIQAMGIEVFSGCTALEQITIKDGLSQIGGKCFDGCNAIKTIKNYCVDVPTTDANAFSSYTATLYVPASAINDYKAADPWKNFVAIDDIENAPSDGLNKVATPTIDYKNGKLTFGCETEGVEFVSEISDADIAKYNTAEVNLTVTDIKCLLGWQHGDKVTPNLSSDNELVYQLII